ncbi:hypothetical protein KIH77_08865 [Bifidobacterium sp. 82T24]|uniref:hypothetical protein n=1 Tax=Bifidobacterium pluvialisilvae TaxID=2834436 RepID=UPI001C58920B|nr:hypothetical protein [Bifidobacterium pluvialisilvae]MBW3088831.1 hypothetical protein [Bifidobacterium pluvialisilvae]
MLALQAYENRVCPLCGMPIGFCHDYDRVHEAFAGGEVELCFVTEMREQAMKQYRESGSVNSNAQTTSLKPRIIDKQ